MKNECKTLMLTALATIASLGLNASEEINGAWSQSVHGGSVNVDEITSKKDSKTKPADKKSASMAKGDDYYMGKGRVAISSDGNMHDNDDMQATMMSLMMLDKAKLHDKLTLYTYADHIWGSEGNDLEIMRHSAEATGEKFGFDKTNFMAAVEDPEKAYNAMRDEILKSTAKDPLFILPVGPMQVVGEALDRAYAKDPNALNYVTVISHSNWNNVHSDKPHIEDYRKDKEAPHSGWTWKEMVSKFGERVNFNLISDQNGTGKGDEPYRNKDKFSAPTWDSWDWMRTHSNPNIQWLYQQARKNPAKPDFSDAGVVYYLCADLNNQRGDEFGNPEKLRQWIGE